MHISLNEFKIKAVKNGFSFQETLSTVQIESMCIASEKPDPWDGLKFTTCAQITFSNWLDADLKARMYVDMVKSTEAAIRNRAEQDVLECNHHFVNNGKEHVCSLCRTKKPNTHQEVTISLLNN